jgi:hypothetical protein
MVDALWFSKDGKAVYAEAHDLVAKYSVDDHKRLATINCKEPDKPAKPQKELSPECSSAPPQSHNESVSTLDGGRVVELTANDESMRFRIALWPKAWSAKRALFKSRATRQTFSPDGKVLQTVSDSGRHGRALLENS